MDQRSALINQEIKQINKLRKNNAKKRIKKAKKKFDINEAVHLENLRIKLKEKFLNTAMLGCVSADGSVKKDLSIRIIERINQMEAKVIEGLLEWINKSVKWEQADAPTFIWEVYSILCKDELRIRSDAVKRDPSHRKS